MRKTIALNTEPHIIEVGPHELELQPEVYGDEFVDAYVELSEAQKAKGVDLENLDEATDPQVLRRTMRAVRVFLARQMLPKSAEFFLRLDVVQDGKALKSFQDLDEAQAFADGHPGARVRDALRLPTRAVVEILETVVELYGGGGRPTTPSSGSARRSRPGGTSGTAPSLSRASTHISGR
ncbi:hypothetical protein ACFOOM_00860 [Streptomyces echinoruber]|uniref:Uncharacterized protein n=1 Tax=Streptomyces echinoruber TaxID=68898 RepID=A0A918V6C9_9ACTN|nr:hypothetical protein [Streptomyces echinoruber]GGZ73308.1 hypothetical protein GCM10010389_08620 [Streptomyces echinoruber]